jgi:uncharacterized protein YndB with AHSA1/START domain
MSSPSGADFRKVEARDHLGKRALVAIATRTYDTSIEDLWNALTTPARIARWLGPLEVEPRLGGRFQIQNNASGSITRCDAPEALDVTWEFGGATSWVSVRLARVGLRSARFVLEHIAHEDGIGKEHLEKFGPGAVGIGWDLVLAGLGLHLASPDWKPDLAWLQSTEAKELMRAWGEAWGEAHVASGADADDARAKAGRTIAAYTGGD